MMQAGTGERHITGILTQVITEFVDERAVGAAAASAASNTPRVEKDAPVQPCQLSSETTMTTEMVDLENKKLLMDMNCHICNGKS